MRATCSPITRSLISPRAYKYSDLRISSLCNFLCRVVTSGLSCPNELLVPIAFRQYPSRKMTDIAEDFMCLRMECTMLSESSGLFLCF